MTTSDPGGDEPDAPPDADGPAQARRPSRAERLEAKAARLREKQERAAGPEAPRPGGLRGWPLVAAGVVVLLMAAAIAYLAVHGSDQADRIHSLEQRRIALAPQPVPSASAKLPVVAPTDTAVEALWASALTTAEQYAVDFGSYDYRNLDQDFQLVSSHLTKGFAQKYAQISQQLKSVIVKYKGSSTATVQGAGVSSLDAKQAVVVLFLDQTVTSTQTKKPTVDRNRLTMTLQRQPDGSWRIADLELQ